MGGVMTLPCGMHQGCTPTTGEGVHALGLHKQRYLILIITDILFLWNMNILKLETRGLPHGRKVVIHAR